MRSIKFRAWDNVDGTMHNVSHLTLIVKKPYVQSVCFEDDYFQEGCALEDVVLMQFTGLHDKHGKEVYEGDVVRHEVFGIKQITFGSRYDALTGSLGFMYDNTIAFLHKRDSDEVEVIGNIHEHPELLGDSK